MRYSRHVCGELHAVAVQLLTQHRCAQGVARAWNSRHVCDELHDVSIQLLDLLDHNTHALVLGQEVVSESESSSAVNLIHFSINTHTTVPRKIFM